MIDIEKLRAKPKEVEFMGDTIRIYPLKTRHIAELGELQQKGKYADASMLLIRETFNRMIEEEEVERLMKEGKTKQEARDEARKKFLTDDDVNEFSQESIDELMPHIMKMNGLTPPETGDKKKQTSKQK